MTTPVPERWVSSGARGVRRVWIVANDETARRVAGAALAPVLADMVAEIETWPHDEECQVDNLLEYPSGLPRCTCLRGEMLRYLKTGKG